MTANADADLEDIEFSLLLEALFRHYGCDFREYAPASLRRRIHKCMHAEGLPRVTALLDRVLHDPETMARFLRTVSVDVTAMFRDPTFYRAIRERVVPLLRLLPFIRVWHVGCATGEEVYSMAIVFAEEGIAERTRIYATDMNDTALREAADGVFPLRAMQAYTDNYQKAGGTRTFSDYYSARYDHALFDPSLRRNVLWAQHNLTTDGSFNEFHLIVCRNVMIYFNQVLQNRVHRLIYESLAPSGILALGSKESLALSPFEGNYEPIDAVQKIFLRVR